MSAISILVVEDSREKLRDILQCLTSVHPISSGDVIDCRDLAEAKRNLKQRRFDLLVIDIAIPSRRDSDIDSQGGVRLLKEISQRKEKYFVPSHVIGLTAHEGLLAEAAEAFAAHNWLVLSYSQANDEWRSRLGEKLQHIVAAAQQQELELRHQVDICIVCALETPELRSVLDLPWDWKSLTVPGDSTRYFRGRCPKPNGEASAIAAAAPRMGMAATAALCSKMIELFRPRYLAMTGIAAGVEGSVNLGDVIVAEPAWDYGSGKYGRDSNGSVFLPEPHQFHLAPRVRELFRSLANDTQLCAAIKQKWRGACPSTELRLHVGPLASGSSVLADADRVTSIRSQNRKLRGIDMEACAVFAAADAARHPAPDSFCIKSVCDFADHMKNDQFQEYAAFTSAQVLQIFLQSYLD
jgi:nucleoside phosphorylase/CheY-like chemotaxis protein